MCVFAAARAQAPAAAYAPPRVAVALLPSGRGARARPDTRALLSALVAEGWTLRTVHHTPGSAHAALPLQARPHRGRDTPCTRTVRAQRRNLSAFSRIFTRIGLHLRHFAFSASASAGGASGRWRVRQRSALSGRGAARLPGHGARGRRARHAGEPLPQTRAENAKRKTQNAAAWLTVRMRECVCVRALRAFFSDAVRRRVGRCAALRAGSRGAAQAAARAAGRAAPDVPA